MENISLRFISEHEVAQIFKNNSDLIFKIVEDAFYKYANGEVIFPDKISIIFNQETQNRINCMPAALLNDNVCGLKWISVFPSNVSQNMQNVTGVMLLSEINHGFPLALIDGTFCTKIRTAAVGCLAAKYLAPSKVEKIGIIGGGEEGRMHFTLLKHLYPSICECRISSRSNKTEQEFIDCFKNITPDVNFIACNNDSHLCAKDADIIVTAISSQEPVLKANDITKGSLYIHVGGYEDEFGVALKANKIIVDDWEASKHRTQTICRMYKQGLLKDSDIYANLTDLILRRKVGRKDDNEFIYFNSVGLSFIDLNFAFTIYNEAIKKGVGKILFLEKGGKVDYKSLI